jgi:hypothetical protein
MSTSQPVISRWRWPVAGALSAIAAIHADLVPEHLREVPYAGGLFIALSAGAVIVAILLLWSGHRLAWAAAGGLSALAIVGYVLSRSSGLPSMSDDVGNWLDPLGIAAVGCELAVLAICVAVLSRGRAQPRRISSTGPATSMGSSPSR